MIGLIVFATAVAVIWTVLYIAYFRSGSTIHAATGQQEPYTAQQDDLGPFFDDYQPDTRSDFQRSVDAGFIQLPDFTKRGDR
ncbi:hypothetical protein ABZ312_11665 [Streptomyces sp. NPDC006207]